MSDVPCDGYDRGFNFDYKEINTVSADINYDSRDTDDLIAAGEAAMATYEIFPELMYGYYNQTDESGDNTPVNTFRPTSVAINEDLAENVSNEAVFFQYIYKAFVNEVVCVIVCSRVGLWGGVVFAM